LTIFWTFVFIYLNQLCFWIVFNHIESGLKHLYTETVFLGLYSIIFAVHNWLFTGQSRFTWVNWLNQEFSFSTSRTNQICEKFLKVQFTPPLELSLNLILQNSFRKWFVCSGELFQFRCCAHILNLIVQEGLKVICDTLDQIRNNIKYVRGSMSRMVKFKQCLKRFSDIDASCGLCLDVLTRWNSTYLMLKSALKCQRVLEACTWLMNLINISFRWKSRRELEKFVGLCSLLWYHYLDLCYNLFYF